MAMKNVQASNQGILTNVDAIIDICTTFIIGDPFDMWCCMMLLVAAIWEMHVCKLRPIAYSASLMI